MSNHEDIRAAAERLLSFDPTRGDLESGTRECIFCEYVQRYAHESHDEGCPWSELASAMDAE